MADVTFSLTRVLTPSEVAEVEAIPGVKIRGGRVSVPHNAVPVVEPLLAAVGYSIALRDDPVRDRLSHAKVTKARLVAAMRPEVPALGRFPDYLTPYQKTGLAALLDCPQASGMAHWAGGSGKSLLSIMWVVAGGERGITITKGAVKLQMAGEIRKYTNLTPTVLDGQTPTPIDLDASWLVLSYEILPFWIEAIEKWARGLAVRPALVLDESQKVQSHKRWTATLDVAAEEDRGAAPVADGGVSVPFTLAEEREDAKVKFTLNDNIAASAYRLRKVCSRCLETTATPVRDRVRNLWAQLDLIHPWGWGSYWPWAKRYCNPPEAPIWMGDFTFKPLGSVRVGDEVIGWEAHANRDHLKKKPNAQFRKAKLTRALVTAITTRIAPIIRVTCASGRIIRCTPDHRWLCGSHRAWTSESAFITPRVGRPLTFVADPTPVDLPPDLARMAGWIAGMYDGEGHGAFISQSSRHNPATFAEIDAVLTRLEIPHTMLRDEDRRSGCGGAYITGGRDGLLRFFRIARPLRFASTADRVVLTGNFKREDQIVRIEADGIGPVLSLTTTTGNYVAWGYASKNCAATERTFGGMDDSGLSNPDELRTRFDQIRHRVTKEEANVLLPPARRQVTFLPVKAQVKASGEVAAMLRAAAAHGPTAVLEARLMEAAGRKRRHLVERVEMAVEAGQKVCVFTGRRADCESLMKTLQKRLRCPVVGGHGGDPVAAREAAREAYMAERRAAVLVGTTDAWGEGLNLQSTDLGLVAMLPYTPGQIIQTEARWSRLGQDRPVLIEYVVAEGTVDERVAQIVLGKLPAMEKVVEQTEIAGFSRQLSGADDPEVMTSLVAAILGGGKESAA